jgi:BMFP domain-containing protein YqiC
VEEKDFKRIEEMMSGMMDRFRGEIGQDFRHQLGLQREDFQHKLDLVVEGQQTLAERMDRFEGRMGRLENRVDGIADDLVAHRRDTEAHRKGYSVREE